MSEWIKVEDRLPPKDTPVLCYYCDTYIDVMEYWYDEQGKHIFFNPPSPPSDNVTHWMPLPEKPNE